MYGRKLGNSESLRGVDEEYGPTRGVNRQERIRRYRDDRLAMPDLESEVREKRADTYDKHGNKFERRDRIQRSAPEKSQEMRGFASGSARVAGQRSRTSSQSSFVGRDLDDSNAFRAAVGGQNQKIFEEFCPRRSVSQDRGRRHGLRGRGRGTRGSRTSSQSSFVGRDLDDSNAFGAAGDGQNQKSFEEFCPRRSVSQDRGRRRGLRGRGRGTRQSSVDWKNPTKDNFLTKQKAGGDLHGFRGHGRGTGRSSVDTEKRVNFVAKQKAGGDLAKPSVGKHDGETRGSVQQKCKGKLSKHSQGNISFQILQSWSDNKDSDDVLLQISNHIESIENLLKSFALGEDWYECLVRVFAAITRCEMHFIKLKKILQMLSASHFLTHLLTNHLDLMEGTAWPRAEGFFTSILNIVQQIAKHMPENAQNCKPALRCLLGATKYVKPVCKNQILQESITSVLCFVTKVHETWSEKQAIKKWYRPCSDNESPPEDFRELSVVPAGNDLSKDANPFVRAVITKGAYKDQEHYLDVQFRLMREDFVKPLRDGIQEFREHGHNKHFKSSDIRLYRDVHFTGMTHINGINHVIQFDVSNMKHVMWDHSKRLLNGNLVCLSNDNFESTLIFATVSFRDTKLLRKGILNIVCHSGLDIVLKTSSNDSFVMVETMAYFEAVYPILKGIQTIDSNLPLKEYIIHGRKHLKPPTYLLQNVRKYDISCLMKTQTLKKTEVSVLNRLMWPSTERLCLNPSQREAAILALTKEISIIQGPPGTGKTYVGLKIMQVLLENQDQMTVNQKSDHDPILVICYTNHALDQFLEGILEFCPDGIVRVGGKSSSDRLEPFNLRNLKKGRRKMSRAWKTAFSTLRDSLKRCSNKIESVKNKLDSLTTDVLSEKMLIQYISTKHYDSLKTEPIEAKRKSSIHQWLNAPNQSLIQTLPRMIKDHMIKLVIKCLQLFQNLNNSISIHPRQSITERVRIYKCWLDEYQYNLRRELEACGGSRPIDANYFSSLYHKSRRPSILNDSEICCVIPTEYFETIIYSIYDESVYENKDHIIETWVLGLQNDVSKKLDDLEELRNFVQKFDRSNDTDADNFDDEEESKNAIKQRQFFEDEDDEDDFFNATLRVTNEGAFLLQRAKFLGVHENHETAQQEAENSADAFQTVTYKKTHSIFQMERFLSDKTCCPMTAEDEKAVENVWELDRRNRFSLYKLWINRFKEMLVQDIENLIHQHSDIKQELVETRMKEDVDILRDAKVIGMTTTGAAKKRAWLEAVGCRIIIVEEAAEVLEAHIVTALNKNCKHLILIGDHKQLRPNPTVYEHAKNFGLDVSLFERLVNNDIPHVTLGEQHRMRESISIIMRHIYPNLQDHISVKGFENIQGVSKNIYFIQHDHDETTVKDSHSKSNPFEAKYLMRLCKYFLLQDYKPSQITILATYGGQVLTLKKEMENQTFKGQVRISTVDNFQGEENDIILLSLVRSNKQSSAGFLKVDNRVCVALSRAKKGMFAIGNIALLASQSNLWKNIMHTAEQESITGDGLPISCPNHPDEKSVIKVPEDFDQCPQGGCLKQCEFRLQCGHICRLTCHGYDLEHKEVQCHAPCNKSCPEGHPCPRQCWQECQDCIVKVPKQIESCGHTISFACSKNPQETDCYRPCEEVLPCGHDCTGKCGGCKMKGHHVKCIVPMTYLWPCGHANEVPCYFKPSENPCPKPCGEVLACGHRCSGKCSDCLEGAVHLACTEKCTKLLFCGHMCQSVCNRPCPPCTMQCPVVCRHRNCSLHKNSRTCGEPCIQCQEPCVNICPHRKCTLSCHQKCDVLPCDRRCLSIIPKCGHQCSALCGEICVCSKCQRVSRFKMSRRDERGSNYEHNQRGGTLLLQIPSCGHIFKLEDIDRYMNSAHQTVAAKFITCPECSTPIQKCNRYQRILKENRQKREENKVKPRYQLSIARKVVFELSVERVQDKDLDGSFRDWWFLTESDVTSFEEFIGLSSKLKFAFVISIIKSLQEENDIRGTENDMAERKTALLKVGKHMTTQQIEEYRVDLRRLLLYRYSCLLSAMAESHGVDLPDDLTKKYIDARKELETIKPTTDVLDLGLDVVKHLENAIEIDCTDTEVQDKLQRKKKLTTDAFDVLNSDSTATLIEAIAMAESSRSEQDEASCENDDISEFIANYQEADLFPDPREAEINDFIADCQEAALFPDPREAEINDFIADCQEAALFRGADSLLDLF